MIEDENINFYEDYKLISIDENEIKLESLYDGTIEINPIDEEMFFDLITELKNLNYIYDYLGFEDKCLESTNDYDNRILELSKEVAKIKFNIDDYEFKITDGSQEKNDFYYIVCWIEKDYLEKNLYILENDVRFKIYSKDEGGSFLLELSKYPKFSYLVERDWMNKEDLVYSAYLTYLYTRNLDKK